MNRGKVEPLIVNCSAVWAPLSAKLTAVAAATLKLRITVALVAIGTAVLAGCGSASDGEKAPVLATAFAGPAVLTLHQDIDAKSPAVVTATHGDKLEIVGQRRRSWYRVRDAKGREGWVSSRELLDSAQMKRLLVLGEQAAKLPSLGKATTFSDVNVHIEPARQATSFVQVKAKEQFDVIGHKVALRAPLPIRQLIPPRPKVEKKLPRKGKGEKEVKASELQPPPPPAPPQPPADLPALSRQGSAQPDSPAASPVPKDDWTLIRTGSGQSGWVLTNAIYLQIPDEVAQHADGHRITSYFSLGKTVDPEGDKDIWLWTTSEKLGADYDFDSYRVFSWSRRHHRYETSYIQRRERGFFPVLAGRGEFSVCLERRDGSLGRKAYRMTDTSVRTSGEVPCEKAFTPENDFHESAQVEEPPIPAAAKGLFDTAVTWWKGAGSGKTRK